MQSIDPRRPLLPRPRPAAHDDSRSLGFTPSHVRGCYRRSRGAWLSSRSAPLLAPLLIALTLLPACSAGPAASTNPPSATSPTTRTIRADWNDVDAALEVALSRAELAILSRTADGPDRITWQLLSIQDDPAQLIATRQPGATQDPTEITLEARIGHFGDPNRELQFLSFVERRLQQLTGVDYAPVTQ